VSSGDGSIRKGTMKCLYLFATRVLLSMRLGLRV